MLQAREQLELYRVERSFGKSPCKPFLKWPGGKRQLLNEINGIISCIPVKYNRYFEPFVGGGALFFNLVPKRAYISDINPELVNAYEVVKNDVEGLIRSLHEHKRKHCEDYYYKIRNVDRDPSYKEWDKVRKASRLIYLNKTCFNGLYRMNSRGQFNVPYGFYKNPAIVDEQNLRMCSAALQGTEITDESFERIEKKVRKGDLVYFDPPYAPLSRTSSFTKYYKDDFNEDKQEALKELCSRLTKKGAYFILSNSYTDSVKKLYKQDEKFTLHTVKASRAINCKAEGRGKINELIVVNF